MFVKKYPATYEELLRDFSVPCPENFNFAFDVVDAVALSEPAREAMIHVSEAGEARRLDFAFFSRASSALANALSEKGIGRGSMVMLILHRRIEFWVSMLALHKLGAIAIPSPSLLTEKDIVYRANFAGVKGIVCDTDIRPRVEAVRHQCAELCVLVQTGKDAPAGWYEYDELVAGADNRFVRAPDSAGGSDPAIVFFSSGTTGQPKMVAHAHTYPLGHYLTGAYWHDLEPGSIHLTVSDTGWGKALWGKFYGQWMAGAIVFVYDFRGKFEAAKLLRVMSRYKITSFCAPPTVYRFLIRENLDEYDLSALRHCTTAGELLNENVFALWRERFGLSIFEGYGQTETTLQVATFPFMKAKPGSIGKPCPGWDVVLLDEEGEPCPTGVEGEICVRLDKGHPVGLFLEYLKNEEKTKSVRYGGYYHTGDKAWQDEDGYFWFMGRVDDLIKSSGYRIGPFEVESVLMAHEAVLEAAVTGLPDPVRGQAVKATIVLASGYEPGEELTKKLQTHVKQSTAPYKYPRVVEYVQELPKTISGKVKRGEIRARDIRALSEERKG